MTTMRRPAAGYVLLDGASGTADDAQTLIDAREQAGPWASLARSQHAERVTLERSDEVDPQRLDCADD